MRSQKDFRSPWQTRVRYLLACPSLLGCSAEPEPEPRDDEPQITWVDPPTLPSSCDVPLPEAYLGGEPAVSPIAGVASGIRAVGNTIYFLGDDGLYGMDFPDGTPRRLVARPGPDSDEQPYYMDFWIDGDALILVTSHGVLYTAPRDGGPPAQVPGSELPVGNLEPAAFTTGGDSVFMVGFDTDWFLFRAPVAGGPWERVAPANYFPRSLGAGANTVYFEDPSGALAALPFAGGEPQVVAPAGSLLMGAEGEAYVLMTGVWQRVLPRHFSPWVMNRAAPGAPAEGGGPELPTGVEYADFWVPLAWQPRMVRFDGAFWFVAQRGYALPDDRRETSRAVLVRFSPEDDTLEVVRCIPPPPFDELLPEGGQETEIKGIAASEEGIFVVRQRNRGLGFPIYAAVDPMVVRVWP